jgi:FkbM family methyltransferase
MPEKIKSYIREKVYKLINPPPRPRYLHELSTYSQAGEDAVLRFLFLDYPLDLSQISYLDIGARHPTNGSNTFLFYSCGSTGVCVEADKTVIPLIQEYRPKDKVLNMGVSTSGVEYGDFYFMESGGSTFDKEEAERRERLGTAKILEVIKVPLTNINTLIKQNFETYPVFLSIDIEGTDLAVLKTLDFDRYPIPVICVETCVYSETHIRPKDNTIVEFLLSKGYEVYADTYVNTLCVNKKWFYSQP